MGVEERNREVLDACNQGAARQSHKEAGKRTFVIRSTGREPIQKEGYADLHKTS